MEKMASSHFLIYFSPDPFHWHIMGKTMLSHFLRCFNWILFIFAGNEDMHKSLDEFEIRPDGTTVPWQQIGIQWEERRHHVFSNFLIGFISYLQVTMIYIRAWMCSKFGEIRQWTTELAAIERLKKSNRLIMEKMASSHFLSYFSSDPFHICRQWEHTQSFDGFEIRPDPTTGFPWQQIVI